MEVKNVFVSYLKKRDLKNTPERLTILHEVLKMKHFEADALLFQLKNQNQKISRATIYRTLDLLVDCGIVKKINFGTDGSRYEPVVDFQRHDHFICVSCGKIIEFFDENLNLIHTRLAAKYKIEILEYTHQIYGKCPECRNKINDTEN